jgi:hypothetical protein
MIEGASSRSSELTGIESIFRFDAKRRNMGLYRMRLNSCEESIPNHSLLSISSE